MAIQHCEPAGIVWRVKIQCGCWHKVWVKLFSLGGLSPGKAELGTVAATGIKSFHWSAASARSGWAMISMCPKSGIWYLDLYFITQVFPAPAEIAVVGTTSLDVASHLISFVCFSKYVFWFSCTRIFWWITDFWYAVFSTEMATH